jgi:serine/threonine protein kinase/tetratricopeptide (TPR) repeat protein
MSDETRLNELLDRWEELEGRGETPTPEDLCRHDPGLVDELRRRIAALRGMDAILEEGLAATETWGADRTQAEALQVPTLRPAVSPYSTLRFHARGGLGEVFRARDERLNRDVAIKLIQRSKAASAEGRLRFEREAEVTGRLEHPGIAPVYATGQCEEGRPYYVMRFIDGETLGDAIRRYHASDTSFRGVGERTIAFRDLLNRFVQVCKAIDHAHGRGVLHRDLKPSNVMLGPHGETLVVDWGLAKLYGDGDHEREPCVATEPISPHLTASGSALGTPAYMAPEQLDGAAGGLGPTTDVYSLGATLYALLTGHAPFEGGDLASVQNRLRRGDYPRPRDVKRDVPRPLEAVCLKAMSHKPEDRYTSAGVLAGEIERWLADEPVTAWREPLSVRLWRWAKRNRTAVASATALLVALAAGLGAVTAVQAQANRALRKAYNAKDQALAETKQAQAETQAALAQSEAVSTFLVEAFRSPDPEQDGRTIKVADLLDRAADKLESEFSGWEATKGALLDALGRTYHGLGLYDRAEKTHTRARAVRESALGANHPDTLKSGNNLARDYWSAGRFSEAIALFEATLKATAARLGPDHPNTLETRGNLALAYASLGRTSEAIVMHEATLERCEKVLGADHAGTLTIRDHLAGCYREAGRFSDAVKLNEETLKRREARQGLDHPDTLSSDNNLALAYISADRLSEAIGLLERTLRLADSKLGLEHPETLTCRSSLANAYYYADRLPEAIGLYESVLKTREARLGADHPDTLLCRNNLANAYAEAGRTLEAIVHYQAALRSQEARLGTKHPETLRTRRNLATTYDDAGRLSEAIALHEKTLELEKGALGVDHPDSLATRRRLALEYQEAGRLSEAVTLLQETLVLSESRFGPDHSVTLGSRNSLALAYESLGRWSDAERLRREALARRKGDQTDDYLEAADLAALGRNLLTQSRWSEAEPLLRECLAIRAKPALDDWRRFGAMSLLGQALTGQGRYAEAEPLIVEGCEGLKARESRIPVPERPRLREAAVRVIRLYEAWGRPAQATAWKDKLAMRDLPAEVFARP